MIKLSENVKAAWGNMVMDSIECEELKSNREYK